MRTLLKIVSTNVAKDWNRYKADIDRLPVELRYMVNLEHFNLIENEIEDYDISRYPSVLESTNDRQIHD